MSDSRPASRIATVVLLFAATAGAAAESPIAASAAVSLSFGQVFSGALPGSVRVSVTGFRSTAGSTYAGNGLGASAARFRVKVPAGTRDSAVWSVMLPVSATISSGSTEMTIDGFEYDWVAAGGDPESRTLTVGATLHVGARQPSSEYAGSFPLTLVYD